MIHCFSYSFVASIDFYFPFDNNKSYVSYKRGQQVCNQSIELRLIEESDVEILKI